MKIAYSLTPETSRRKASSTCGAAFRVSCRSLSLSMALRLHGWWYCWKPSGATSCENIILILSLKTAPELRRADPASLRRVIASGSQGLHGRSDPHLANRLRQRGRRRARLDEVRHHAEL